MSKSHARVRARINDGWLVLLRMLVGVERAAPYYDVIKTSGSGYGVATLQDDRVSAHSDAHSDAHGGAHSDAHSDIFIKHSCCFACLLLAIDWYFKNLL